ncbi:MAG: hypothetical protein JNL21_10545 [Myxococcales bacterium]|nr:hypothetical protein [Myxococcales bacterium]
MSGTRAMFSYLAGTSAYDLIGNQWIPVATPSLPDVLEFRLSGDFAFPSTATDILALRYASDGWQYESVLASRCSSCEPIVEATSSVAVVGQPLASEVQIFDRVDDAWALSQTLLGSAGDFFGYRVSIDGNRLAVCASDELNGLGPDLVGMVHVFEKLGQVWAETGAFPAPYSCGSPCSGMVIRAGRISVIGACHISSFELVNDAWTQIGPATSYFDAAQSVAIWGDTLVIGQGGAEYMGQLSAGRVEFFRSVPTGWELESTILPLGALHGVGSYVGAGDGWALVGNAANQAQFFARVGTACVTDEQCPTGHCVDGFCCDSACASNCMACDAAGSEGVCTLVTGVPHGNRPACEAPSCSGDTLDQGASCNGLVPECTLLPPVSCAPFVCSEGACRSPCTTKDDCVVQHVCANGACIPDSTSCATETILVHADGSTDDCTPYRCGSTGACVTHCASTEECAPGTVCTADGACLPTDTIEGSGSSCAAERTAPRSTDGTFWLGALASLTALRRLSARCLQAPGSRRPARRSRSASLRSSSADR